MSTFLELKKNRELASKQRMAAMAKTAAGKSKGDDDTYWAPTIDTEGNGEALIRYLTAPEGEDLALIPYWDHVFNGPGGWFFEKSLTTLGQTGEPFDSLREIFGSDDPVTEYNSMLWNRNGPGDRERVSGQPLKKIPGTKRKLHYVSNVYIINDPAKPQMNGTVKRYKYGAKLFGILNNAANPKFASQRPCDPFNMWDGANLRIRVMKDAGWPSYSSSVLETPGPLVVGSDGQADDAAIEAIWKQCHSLLAVVARSEFKSYAVLKARMNKVLGLTGDVGTPTPATAPVTIPGTVALDPQAATASEAPWDEDTKVDDDLDGFRALAN
jgi:hypothetical protein